MKKQILFLAGICAIGFFVCKAHASVPHHPQQNNITVEMEDNHIPSEAEKIKLQGKLNYNVGPDDIEAGATETAVYIYFNQSCGNVNISLYNAEGNLCYSSVVNTGAQQMVVIPIMGNSNGTYTVVLDNANGYAEGDFERQNH